MLAEYHHRQHLLQTAQRQGGGKKIDPRSHLLFLSGYPSKRRRSTWLKGPYGTKGISTLTISSFCGPALTDAQTVTLETLL